MFQTSQPASLAVTGSKGETSIPDKFHDHTNHVLIREKSQQLAGEATMPDSVISTNTAPGFFFASKESSMFCVCKTT